MRIRPARLEDYDGIVAFTADTWADRGGGDYIPRVFEEWVRTDGDRQHTGVAVDEDDTPTGIVQTVMLSEHEAWLQGMRVDPTARDGGIGLALAHDGFDWARERGATVARNMVFSWNTAGLGHSRAAGFGTGPEFRWVHPEPDPDAEPAATVTDDVHAAWSFWRGSDACRALDGLGISTEESWAVAEVTPAVLRGARDAESLLVLDDGDGTAATSYRSRTYDRENDEGVEQTWAEYGISAWRDVAAAGDLLAAIARDAAGVGADRIRVLVPERTAAIGDAAVHRVEIGEGPDFVTVADLTAPYRTNSPR